MPGTEGGLCRHLPQNPWPQCLDSGNRHILLLQLSLLPRVHHLLPSKSRAQPCHTMPVKGEGGSPAQVTPLAAAGMRAACPLALVKDCGGREFTRGWAICGCGTCLPSICAHILSLCLCPSPPPPSLPSPLGQPASSCSHSANKSGRTCSCSLALVVSQSHTIATTFLDSESDRMSQLSHRRLQNRERASPEIHRLENPGIRNQGLSNLGKQ